VEAVVEFNSYPSSPFDYVKSGDDVSIRVDDYTRTRSVPLGEYLILNFIVVIC